MNAKMLMPVDQEQSAQIHSEGKSVNVLMVLEEILTVQAALTTMNVLAVLVAEMLSVTTWQEVSGAHVPQDLLETHSMNVKVIIQNNN
jgi:hypothetical protein